jgi:hypothetical protein
MKIPPPWTLQIIHASLLLTLIKHQPIGNQHSRQLWYTGDQTKVPTLGNRKTSERYRQEAFLTVFSPPGSRKKGTTDICRWAQRSSHNPEKEA